MLYGINLLISFVLELAMLAVFAYAGFYFGEGWLQYALGIGIPVVVVIFWAKKMAPRAPHRFAIPVLLIITLILFGLAAVSLYLSGLTMLALIFAIVALINVGLRIIMKNQGAG